MYSVKVSDVFIIPTEKEKRLAYLKTFFAQFPSAISIDQGIELMERLKAKFLANKCQSESAKREKIRKFITIYFAGDVNAYALQEFYDYLLLLLQCHEQYYTQGKRRDLFGENSDDFRGFLFDLAELIDNDWKALQEREEIVEHLIDEILHERASHQQFAHHMEEKVIHALNLHIDRVAALYNLNKNEYENALKKDYESYNALLKEREKLPSLLSFKLIGECTGFVGGPIMAKLGMLVGGVFDDIAHLAFSAVGQLISEEVNEKLVAFGKNWTGAIQKWSLENIEHQPNYQFITTKQFIQNQIYELHGIFLKHLHSRACVRSLIYLEREKVAKHHLRLLPEAFYTQLKRNVCQRLDEYLHKYSVIIQEIKDECGASRRNSEVNAIEVASSSIFSLNQLHVPWVQDERDCWLDLKKPGQLEVLRQRTIPANSDIRKTIRHSAWIKQMPEKEARELLEMLGFADPKPKDNSVCFFLLNKLRAQLDRKLGCESAYFREQAVRSQLSFISLDIIHRIFEEYCGTYLPNMMRDPLNKLMAVQEIFNLAMLAFFRQKSPNILLTLFIHLPGIEDLFKEIFVREWVVHFLNPASAAYLQIPDKFLQNLWNDAAPSQVNHLLLEKNRLESFLRIFEDKKSKNYLSAQRKDLALIKYPKKFSLEISTSRPRGLDFDSISLNRMPTISFKPDSFYLYHVSASVWNLIYYDKKGSISHVPIHTIEALDKIISNKTYEALTSQDKKNIFKALKLYRDTLLAGTQPRPVTDKEVEKAIGKGLHSLVSEPVLNRTELRFVRLLLPYKKILQKHLPLSFAVLGQQRHEFIYTYYLMAFIEALKQEKQLGVLIDPTRETLTESQEKISTYFDSINNILLKSVTSQQFEQKKILLEAIVQFEYDEKVVLCKKEGRPIKLFRTTEPVAVSFIKKKYSLTAPVSPSINQVNTLIHSNEVSKVNAASRSSRGKTRLTFKTEEQVTPISKPRRLSPIIKSNTFFYKRKEREDESDNKLHFVF